MEEMHKESTVNISALLDSTTAQYDINLELRDKQRDALVHILEYSAHKHFKSDTIISLPTGYGKSLIFHLLTLCLHTLHDKKGITLVFTPLTIIQEDQLKKLKEKGIKACQISQQFVVKGDECASIVDIARGKYHLIICHPESLFTHPKGQDLLFVDECHTVELW